jgi:lysozyme family protein
MALVPRYSPQVQANTGTGPILNPTANPDAAGAPIARALGQAGETLDAIGGELHNNALKMQEQDNQIAKDQASTQFAQALNDHLHNGDGAFYNLQGKAAYDMYASGDLSKQIEAMRNQYRDTLSNPRAQILYDNDTRRFVMLADQNSAVHASQQRKAWFKETDDNAVSEATKLSSQATNDQQLGIGLGQLHTALTQQGAHENWDETTLRVETAKAESTFYKTHVEAVAANDPVQALGLVTQYQKDGKFYGDEGVKLLHAVHGLADPLIGLQAANEEQSKAQGNSPTQDGDIVNYIVGKYENNPTPIPDRHGVVKWGINSDAHPELGVAGVSALTEDQAKAIYQKQYVAPFANANIPPNTKLAVIDSAILAGVGRTQKMVAQATTNGVFDPSKFAQLRAAALPNDPTRKNGWLARIQDGAAGGQLGDRSAVDVMGDFANMEKNIQSRVTSGELTTSQGSAAISQLRASATMNAQIERATMADNMNVVLGAVQNRGDGHAATSLQELYKIPGAQQAYAQLPEAQKLHIQRTISQINTVSKPMTTAEMETFNTMQIQAATDPAGFTRRDIPAEAAKNGWSPAMTRQSNALWSKSLRGEATQLPPSIAHAMSLPAIKTLINNSDIMTDKDKGTMDTDKALAFQGALYHHIAGYEAVYGKKPNDNEIIQTAGAIMAGGHLNTAHTTTVLHGRGADGKSVTDIPDQFLSEAKDYFRARGVIAPTMTQYSQLWRANQTKWSPN